MQKDQVDEQAIQELMKLENISREKAIELLRSIDALAELVIETAIRDENNERKK